VESPENPILCPVSGNVNTTFDTFWGFFGTMTGEKSTDIAGEKQEPG
jgi:hypothetical protein